MIRTTEIVTSKSHIEPLSEDGYVIYKLGFLGRKKDGRRSMYPLWGNVKQGGNTNIYNTYITNNYYQVNIFVANTGAVIELPVEPQADTVAVYLNGVRQMPASYTVNVDNTITPAFQVNEGDSILIDFVAATTHGTIYNEIPTGLINGVNKDFATSRSPTRNRPYKNGQRLRPDEFTTTATGFTLNIAPLEGDTLLNDFDY